MWKRLRPFVNLSKAWAKRIGALAHHLLCSDLAKSCLCFYLLSHHADGGALDTVHATQETFYWTAFQSYNPIFDDLSLRPLGRKQISTLNQKQEGARVSQDC